MLTEVTSSIREDITTEDTLVWGGYALRRFIDERTVGNGKPAERVHPREYELLDLVIRESDRIKVAISHVMQAGKRSGRSLEERRTEARETLFELFALLFEKLLTRRPHSGKYTVSGRPPVVHTCHTKS